MSDTPRTFVMELPDHIDRIVWRGNYYHLPLNTTDLAAASADAALLDWAESRPLDAYARITAQWADCGRGGREVFFNFRHALQSAREHAENSK